MNKILSKNAVMVAMLFTILTLCIGACSPANNLQSSYNTDSLIQAKSFVFVPQSVNPMGGRTRQLASGFALTITADTVQSYLPYFGRAYTAPIGASRGAMDFTLTQFDYAVQPQGEGRWRITIRPRESADIREMQLQVFNNGNASLQAFSNNRQNISYNGYIQPRRMR